MCAGGKGQYSRQTPHELLLIGERVGFDGNALALASRLVAKVDSAAVQDGFDLYLHGFVVANDGRWTVIQQGMNIDARQARRYHWHSENLKDFVDEPHAAIDGHNQGTIINLTDRRASTSRSRQVGLINGDPDSVITEFAKISGNDSCQQPALPRLALPSRHDVRSSDVKLRRLHATLTAAANRGPTDFSELLLTPGVGARTVQALAMVAEVVHGAPCGFDDPARFSLAHGGKDRHPFPRPLRVHDETICAMKSAVQNAKLGREEEISALKRLDAEARRVEGFAKGPSLDAFVGLETARSSENGGRSVFGWEGASRRAASIRSR